jgi:hypothetical protein
MSAVTRTGIAIKVRNPATVAHNMMAHLTTSELVKELVSRQDNGFEFVSHASLIALREVINAQLACFR